MDSMTADGSANILKSPGKLGYTSPNNYFSQNASSRNAVIMKAAASDIEQGESQKEGKVGAYSWFILAIMVLIRVTYQWHRSIFSYCYGYTGLGIQAGNPIFELATAYP